MPANNRWDLIQASKGSKANCPCTLRKKTNQTDITLMLGCMPCSSDRLLPLVIILRANMFSGFMSSYDAAAAAAFCSRSLIFCMSLQINRQLVVEWWVSTVDIQILSSISLHVSLSRRLCYAFISGIQRHNYSLRCNIRNWTCVWTVGY